jgi:predicted transcriptional regulator
MEIHLNPELQPRINRAARENDIGPAEYVRQVVDVWYREQVKKGLDQLERGKFMSHEEVGARIEQMFRA